jgi:hypothetical protein
MSVVLGAGCFYIVRHFRALNKARDDESIAKKKLADRRVAEAAHAGHLAEAGFGDDTTVTPEDVSLLDSKRMH